MKHKLKLLTLMLTSSVFLAGCFPTGEKNIPPKTTSNSSQTENNSNGGDISTVFFPDGIVNIQSDNLSIGFTIPTDAPDSVQKISLKPKELDVETVKNVVLKDKTITDAAEQYPGSKTIIYKTSDNCRLVAYPDAYTYVDSGVGDNSKNYGNIAQHFDKFYYSSDEELSSFSRQDAIDRVNKILDETGIENYAEPYVIPITAKEANDYLEENGSFSKNGADGEKVEDSFTLWEQDEGIYVLKYPFKYNGIELCTGNLKAAGASAVTVGAQITAYVTKDKIFYITISAAYDVVSENAGTVGIDFNADFAANEFVNYYSKQVLTTPKYFTECKLEYVPLENGENSEIIFTPAWCFMGHIISGTENDIVTDCAEYYYADTGIRMGSY